MAAKVEKQRDDRVALHHPDARVCSVDGRVFAADEKGVFRVPAEAAAALAAHGFAPVPEPVAGEAE